MGKARHGRRGGPVLSGSGPWLPAWLSRIGLPGRAVSGAARHPSVVERHGCPGVEAPGSERAASHGIQGTAVKVRISWSGPDSPVVAVWERLFTKRMAMCSE